MHLPDCGVLETVVLVGLSKAGLKDGILRFPLSPTEIHEERWGLLQRDQCSKRPVQPSFIPAGLFEGRVGLPLFLTFSFRFPCGFFKPTISIMTLFGPND